MCSSDRDAEAPTVVLSDVLDALAAVDLDTTGTAALGAELLDLGRQLARLEAQWLRRLERFDRQGGADAQGSASTAAWLQHHAHLTPAEASERVGCARRLVDTLPATAAALAAGDISYRHVAVLSRATADVDPNLVAEAEATLVEAATHLHPQHLRRLAVHWRHVVDAETSLHDAEAIHERRYLSVSTTLAGTVALDGLLAPDDGAVVLAALHALSAPHRDDSRTPGQRRADALVELARRALDGGELPETGGERPHITVTVDLATLEARAPAPAADVDWTGPICGEAARRLACDAAVSRIITEGPSEVLDVGRRTRTVPPALRKAVVVRDGGCTFAGCDRPPPWCDAHHIKHWADGGATSLENLTLLCRHHHRLLHEGRWRLPTSAPRRQPRARSAPCRGAIRRAVVTAEVSRHAAAR
ncbi:MAG: DUF222 domain-containing protein [Frankiaceae bacterium]